MINIIKRLIHDILVKLQNGYMFDSSYNCETWYEDVLSCYMFIFPLLYFSKRSLAIITLPNLNRKKKDQHKTVEAGIHPESRPNKKLDHLSLFSKQLYSKEWFDKWKK